MMSTNSTNPKVSRRHRTGAVARHGLVCFSRQYGSVAGVRGHDARVTDQFDIEWCVWKYQRQRVAFAVFVVVFMCVALYCVKSPGQSPEIDDSLFDVPENYGLTLASHVEVSSARHVGRHDSAASSLQRSPLTESAQRSEWPNQVLIGQFHFHSANKLKDQQRLASELTNLRLQLETLTDCSLELERIHIVILESHREFQRYIRHYFPGAPDRRALFIKIGGPGIVFTFEHDDWLVDLRHEVTHALVHQRFPEIDLWLDEGLAEYFEKREDPQANSRSIAGDDRASQASSVRELLRRDSDWIMTKSMSGVQTELSPDDYVKARQWVSALIHQSPDSRDLLSRYFADLRRGTKTPMYLLIRGFVDAGK